MLLTCFVGLLLMNNSKVYATMWEELEPQEIEERADVIVKGHFNFSKNIDNDESTVPFSGVQFVIDKDYKGGFFNTVEAGIDRNDLSRIRKFQNEGGEFLLFLENTSMPILSTVGGSNGVIFIKDGEVRFEDNKSKKYFEKFLGINKSSNFPIAIVILCVSLALFVMWFLRKSKKRTQMNLLP